MLVRQGSRSAGFVPNDRLALEKVALVLCWHSKALCSLKVTSQGSFPPDPTATQFRFYPVSVASVDGGTPTAPGAVIQEQEPNVIIILRKRGNPENFLILAQGDYEKPNSRRQVCYKPAWPEVISLQSLRRTHGEKSKGERQSWIPAQPCWEFRWILHRGTRFMLY